jgi:asparagine synthase (glutamine-hydrolysing)
MCGLFTVVNNGNEKFNIIEHLECIEHRGPDDFGWVNWADGHGEYSKENKVISGDLIQGHTRLSILDLSPLGWQPMKSDCERFSLVYNGEIYNFIELREELVNLGVKFNSHSDTEVLLKGLIQWQEALLPKLRGMFAFTFFDSLKKEVIIARDFFGIKPLFYAELVNGIAFSSEVQQLLLCAGVSSQEDNQMVYEYLINGASEHSGQSMYKDIKHFPAASYAKVRIGTNEKLSFKKYWQIDLTKAIKPTFEEATKKVRELFLESVKLHMRSDVPLGAALSGGIDSSAIVCAVRHLYPQQELHTFSFIADDKKLSEEKWIDIVNKHVNAKVHKITATKEELVKDLDDLINTQGEPFGSTSIYAQYRVFKKANEQGITVMLDGQGADEMLAGYVLFQSTVLAKLIKQIRFFEAYNFFRSCSQNTSSTSKYLFQTTVYELMPAWLGKIAKKFFLKQKRIAWLSHDWVDTEVDDSKRYKRKKNTKVPLKAHLKSNLCDFGIPHLLRYEDRDSMRWSIESRVPFLHVDLVEYLYSLPEEYLLNKNGVSKYIFREAMRGIVPDVILDRKDKVGFATPEKEWLTKMGDWVNDKLNSSHDITMLDHQELKREWQSVIKGEVAFDFRCWRWLNLITWLRNNK